MASTAVDVTFDDAAARASGRVMGTSHPARGPAVALAAPPAGSNTAQVDWPAELVALYRERRTALVRVAYLLTSDARAAEEIVHGAALALRDRWADIDAPRASLQKAVLDGSRAWSRRHRTGRHPDPEAVGPGRDEMWEALAVLREKERTAVILHFYADLPDDAIAAVLSCRPATVRSLVRRGRARLRKEVER